MMVNWLKGVRSMKVIYIIFFMVIFLGNIQLLLTSPLLVEVPVQGETAHPICFMYSLKAVSAQTLFEQCRKNNLCDSKPLILTVERQVGEETRSEHIQEGTGEDKKILTDLEHGSMGNTRVSLSYQDTSFKDRVFIWGDKALSHPVLGPIIVFGSFYTFLIYLLMKH